MAISGLQTIQVGLQNESTGSDSLYTAFTKTRDNFGILANTASPYNTFTSGTGINANANATTNTVTITNIGVTSIIAGNNITVSSSNGNVTISSTISNSTASGSNTQIQFNDAGILSGNTNFTFNKTTGVFSALYLAGNGNGLSNIQGANVSGAVTYATTANSVAGANVSGQVGNSLIAGTVYTAAQPNITSVGTLTSLSVTGNISGGNINVSNGRSNVTGTANTVGGGATVGVSSILAIDSAFGSNDANDPASAQAVRGRVTGSNLTKTRNYVAGVTGQYLVTGTNASEFINTGLLGVVGDQTTTANAAVVAYLDGDGGLTTAGSAYGVSMKNSTPGSGFDYGLDLQFINLNVAGTTTPFKQADIRFNNGVELVANVANTISIGANLTVTGTTSTGVLSLNSSEDLADAAAVNLLVTASYFTTVAAETATLAAGTAGQIKTFMMVSSGGNMVITVTNPGWGGSGTMTFSNTGDSCTLQYIASKWFCIGNNGAIFA